MLDFLIISGIFNGSFVRIEGNGNDKIIRGYFPFNFGLKNLLGQELAEDDTTLI